MRWLFWFLALSCLAVAVSLGARLNEGYILLVFPPWRAEVSLNLFLLALLLLFVLFYGILRGILVTFELPRRAREFRGRRQRDKAMTGLEDAVRLLFEGRYGQALRKAGEAHAAGVYPGLAALIATRSAQRLRDPQRQQHWAERARQDDPRSEAAVLMLQARMANEMREYETALQALTALQQRYGRHLAALLLELRARQGVGQWNEVVRLARQLEKRAALPGEAAHEIKLAAHLENVRSRAGDGVALQHYLRNLPAGEADARLALAVARELATLGAADEAADIIEAQLDSDGHWRDDLVLLYGRLESRETTARIAKAEVWLPEHPENASLLLTLGRLCRRRRLWGKAQSYFEASLAVGRTPEAHWELAQMFDQLDKHEEANRHYRQSAEQMR